MVVKVKLQLKSYYSLHVHVCEHREFKMVVMYLQCIDGHEESWKVGIN